MIETKSLFIPKLFELLNQNYNYAVLRGFGELPNNFSSHDIDVLVEKEQFKNLKKELFELLKQEGYDVLMVNENERFNTIIIAKVVSSKLDFLYLDFFFNYSLYGVNLIDAKDVLQDKIFNGKIYHVSKLHEYLEKYLNCKLLNNSYPEKYKSIQQDVFKSNSFNLNNVFKKVFCDSKVDLNTIGNYPGKTLLIKAFFGSLRNRPLKQFKLSSEFIYYYVKGKCKPNGFSFSITGPDGSGKTTILNELHSILSEVYRETTLNHFRPTIIPRLAEVFKKSGLKREVDENYSEPHRGGKTGVLSSIVRLFYYIIDYVVGYNKIIKPVLFRRGVVIFDRYFTDIISDSKRSRININFKFIFFFRKFVPKLNYNFIIFVKPDIILQRKQELTKEQINSIYKKLNYVCDNDSRYKRIENNTKPDVAINEIIDFILKNQDNKYASYFI